ncbi:hypothetical protein PSECIP111951_02442 [Pseudoalteromonas holothuriae]|uniref:HTH cro/C1-type domain-containing protein n=1 Tax=Pseudoalteromonas holothuriae TaxID=2963714 RepID=A0ABM9GJ88_9GAMM|nr:DUF3612 domain-containing protein [Pseudoalteromonas sp. CIP111951]CAH9061224.1 hypothetical protein PSECIP111951_02442 [Pseudoalteromonas sp. CIP111951]
MKKEQSLMRKSHFLGTKIRNLRKRNHLTLEDLSTRCIRVDPHTAPSVSYLSMIERGKRTPSQDMLENLSAVFQKPVTWFLDNEPEAASITPTKGNHGGIVGMALEPNFLFSNDILQIAIPEMLSQTGISGRQFAHLLIRAHQEHHQNHFPDLERAAEEVGNKNLFLNSNDLMTIATQHGLQIRWFNHSGNNKLGDEGEVTKCLTTSYFELPNTVYLNEALKSRQSRLKYDLAVHIGHAVLHNQEGLHCKLTIGGHSDSTEPAHSTPNAQDILNAWRDFEASFFAGALLCPKVPFRQLLDSHGYEVSVHKKLDISASVAMRRMTVVSPYPHWHYFDAYQPGKLKAVYRGNGIPLPWGNMRTVQDPCQHWAVFRKFAQASTQSSTQLSILLVEGKPRLYCCESIQVEDLAGNPHVLCAGLDLNPAIAAQGVDVYAVVSELQMLCIKHGGSSVIPHNLKQQLMSVARILNIAWVERALSGDVRVICTRGNACPRQPGCYEADKS